MIGTAEEVVGLDELTKLGAKVYPGVKAAFADILARVGADINE